MGQDQTEVKSSASSSQKQMIFSGLAIIETSVTTQLTYLVVYKNFPMSAHLDSTNFIFLSLLCSLGISHTMIRSCDDVDSLLFRHVGILKMMSEPFLL
ncbi:hypothetical protein F4809DRAFT_613155 [Biscogniauxia mediterranea]|nr:hypothetical protein F4809DRAFT_613155 [Biscogniauxia mediterranea]